MPTEPGIHVEDLITSIVNQLQTVTGLDKSLVFAVRQELTEPKIKKSVQLITVFPSQFVPDVGQQSGGSTTTFVLNGVFIVTIWNSYMVDQAGQGDKWYSDPNRGILPLMRKVMSALEQFFPLDSNSNYMLEEPMRMSPGGFEILPASESGLQPIRSEWNANFIAKLT